VHDFQADLPLVTPHLQAQLALILAQPLSDDTRRAVTGWQTRDLTGDDGQLQAQLTAFVDQFSADDQPHRVEDDALRLDLTRRVQGATTDLQDLLGTQWTAVRERSQALADQLTGQLDALGDDAPEGLAGRVAASIESLRTSDAEAVTPAGLDRLYLLEAELATVRDPDPDRSGRARNGPNQPVRAGRARARRGPPVADPAAGGRAGAAGRRARPDPDHREALSVVTLGPALTRPIRPVGWPLCGSTIRTGSRSRP
jgi:hypothetical protein